MKKKIKLSPGGKGLLFLLALFLLFRLPFWFAAWQMSRAIDFFDAHKTDFELSTFIPLPPLDLRSDQLTPEQLDIIQQYVESYRFEKTAFLRDFYVDGGPCVFLDFDTPYGRVSLAEGQVHWTDPLGGRWAARFDVDRACTQRLINLLTDLAEQNESGK